jgi:Poly A polymerase head domain
MLYILWECCLQASRRRKAAAAAWTGARQANAHARDFTVNSLMYDPFDSVLYDYTGDSGSVLVLARATSRISLESVCTGVARLVRSITPVRRWGGGLQKQDAARSWRS